MTSSHYVSELSSLASLMLRASINWLDTYAGIDDVGAFATQP